MGWKLRQGAKRYTPVFQQDSDLGIKMAEFCAEYLLFWGRPLEKESQSSSFNWRAVQRSLVIECFASTLRTPLEKPPIERLARLLESITDYLDS